MEYYPRITILTLAFAVCHVGCARQRLESVEAAATGREDDEARSADAGIPESELGDVDAEGDDVDSPNDPPPQACAVVEAKDTLSRVPADVVWVIDDSGSMGDEQARVRENIANFATQIGSAGVDVHVVFVTEEDLAQGTALEGKDSYLFVEADVGSHNSLEVLLETFSTYQGHLRSEAQTHLVALTDDDSDLPATRFRTDMETRLGHGFTFHAIASENVGGDACECGGGGILGCGAAAPGDAYYTLAADTGGEQVSICTVDWGAVFDRLAKAVLLGAPLPCSFALPAAPNGGQLDPERVKFDFVSAAGSATEIPKLGGDECGTLAAWHFDAASAPTKIELCPSACQSLSAGGSVRIALGCAPVVVK